MTDITDRDRLVAHEWAASVDPEMDRLSDSARAVARVILATVDAPDPTLAERLRYRADLLDNGDPDGDTPQALRDLAASADQMGHDLAEARAEVGRLTAERDREKAISKGWMEAHQKLAEHHAESVTVATVAPEENVAADQQANTQGILAGSLPNPADVKPGEAWVVECRGERRTAVKDNGIDIPWNTINADGWYLSEDNEDVTPITRMVPAPRAITNPDELDRLAEGSIVRDRAGHAWERYPDEDWYSTEELDDGFSSRRLADYAGPVTVLWEPEA